ncbi:MAG TPA: initiation factor 2B [Chloroflexaceae bacterium]|nr:initiation factor 2B [Chloroflexaceae bacterium]
MDRFTAQAVAAIAEDNLSGAVEIAEKSAEVVQRLARTDQSARLEELRGRLLELSWALIRAHPTMAPLVNLVNAVLWTIDGAPDPETARRAVAEATGDFKRRLRVHEAAIAETALRLIPDDGQILTNGRSTTVRAALRHAQRAGRRFRVICAEGRPACEGRTLAAELAGGGIQVSLVIDALAVAMVAESRLVLVGADHLGGYGLVNKVGTYGIALAAQAHNVPMYALCGSEKFLPPGFVPPSQAHWPAEQVWDAAPAQVAISNLYFDCTPLSALAGIVTEQGVQPAVGIEAWLAATKLHPDLRQA